MKKNIQTITRIQYDSYEEAMQDVGLYGKLNRCFINGENEVLEVEWLREGLPENATPQETRREPKQLPPHMKVKMEVSIETKDLEGLSAVLNNVEKYWPGMTLYQYGIAQRVGLDALTLATLINYPPEEEQKEEEALEELENLEELGDIMYDE